MKPKIQAILNIDEGEEIAGGWATPHIPQTGIYKFLAKKKGDGTFEWAHFVQRDNGSKENIYRGEAKSRQQLEETIEVMNRNLKKIFGVVMVSAKYDVYSLEGKKTPPQVH